MFLALMGVRCLRPHNMIGHLGLVIDQVSKLRSLPTSHQYSPRIRSQPWMQSRSAPLLREPRTPPFGLATPRRHAPFC